MQMVGIWTFESMNRYNKQASGKEEMDMVGPRPQNGPLLTSTNRSNMGARGQTEKGSTTRDLEKDY